MSVRIKLTGLLALAMMLTPSASNGKILLRWTQPAVPAVKTLGVNELVIPWNDAGRRLLREAKKQGYRVYAEAGPEEASEAAKEADKEGLAGIVVREKTASEVRQLEELVKTLRTAHPKLAVLVESSKGKQPKIRGWLVFKKDGILQVSSPTSQPWLDGNLALVRFTRAFDASQAPLYSFAWDLSDPLVQLHGLTPEDYSLAIAEAGAFHSDLILDLHEKVQAGLASGAKEAVAEWNRVIRYLEFYEKGNRGITEAEPRVAVLTDDYESSYEATNLMARHNIPFAILHSAEVKPHTLAEYDVVIVFAALGMDLTSEIAEFARNGGIAVLVNLGGKYPWQNAASNTNGHSTTYSVGKGRVIELAEPVTDPTTFSQDIRRLMVKERVPVSLWNSLTTLVLSYSGEKPGERIVELLNYDAESSQVQAQVKGHFESVRYETPESGCCQTLKTTQVDGFTEFVIPNLVIGGRVHLLPAAVAVTPKADKK